MSRFTPIMLTVCGALLLLCGVRPLYAEDSSLEEIVALAAEIDDAELQIDLLSGTLEAVRGRKDIAIPKSWKTAYPAFKKSPNEKVRQLAILLALKMKDPVAIGEMRSLLFSKKHPAAERQLILENLLEVHPDDFSGDLIKHLDDPSLRLAAIGGLAAYKDPQIADILLGRYAGFNPAERQAALSTLASRKHSAEKLLAKLEAKQIDASDVSAFNARQLQSFQDDRLTQRFAKLWGQVRETPQEKLAEIERYRKVLTPDRIEKANARLGRVVFNKTCAKCHKLYGEGGLIGPDLTGSNRADREYFLENVVDPSAQIGKDYRLTSVITEDGRILSGIVQQQNERTVTIQTVEKKLVLAREDIDEMIPSKLSMMPEGQMKTLSNPQIRNLFKYLSTRAQVPLPDPSAK